MVELVETRPAANPMTYWTLNAVFLGAVALLVAIGMLARCAPRWRTVALTLAILLAFTAVFDNVMISVGLVAYDPDAISGAFIGVAPLEDFAYAVAAGIGLPALWALLTPPRRSSSPTPPRRSSSPKGVSRPTPETPADA